MPSWVGEQIDGRKQQGKGSVATIHGMVFFGGGCLGDVWAGGWVGAMSSGGWEFSPTGEGGTGAALTLQRATSQKQGTSN